MKRVFILILFLLSIQNLFSEEVKNSDEEQEERKYLAKIYTVVLEAKVDLYVPLEVVSDINLNIELENEEIKIVPFEIELNKKPDKENYYSIKYSESAIDIDGDGKIDTYIYSPKYINEKINKENYIKIYGENITKDGTYKKTIYLTVEGGE